MPEQTANSTFHSRSPELLSVPRSQLLIVDVQEKLLPVIAECDPLLATIGFLLDVANILQVPAFVSEQYPKGLGTTVPAIAQHDIQSTTFEKLRFSAAEGLRASRTASDECGRRDQVVVVGIEAHICVLQTALDLIASGLRVFVVADGVGSRNVADRHTALKRIRDCGGVVCTAESVAFEWCEVAGSDQFKSISRLVRDRSQTSRAASPT